MPRPEVRHGTECGAPPKVFRMCLDDSVQYVSGLAISRILRRLGLNRHRFTCPHTPHTNGKAERFIQTALREWAYARSYPSPPTASGPISVPGSTTTTGIAPTPASAMILLSADSPLPGTTC